MTATGSAPRTETSVPHDGSVIVLLRHAATTGAGVCQGARHDLPLSEEGRRQAHEAARRLGPVDRCVVSPLGRAQATAAVLGVPPQVDLRWRERDFGVWEGRGWSQVLEEVPPEARDDVTAYLRYTPPRGEPWSRVGARVGEALDELANLGGVTLVVTHGGPIRIAVAHALGIALETAVRLHPSHGSSVWLRRTAGEWQLDRFGW